MARFSFQKHILDLSVLVFIDFRMAVDVFCCDLTLHDPGLFCITAHIIQLFPLHQVFSYRFPVKEDHRNVFIPCHSDDPGRSCPVHKIDTEHITAGINHLFHLFVLFLLIVVSAFCRYDNPSFFVFHGFQLRLQFIRQSIDKRIILSVGYHSDPQGFLCLVRLAGTPRQHKHRTPYRGR